MEMISASKKFGVSNNEFWQALMFFAKVAAVANSQVSKRFLENLRRLGRSTGQGSKARSRMRLKPDRIAQLIHKTDEEVNVGGHLDCGEFTFHYCTSGKCIAHFRASQSNESFQLSYEVPARRFRDKISVNVFAYDQGILRDLMAAGVAHRHKIFFAEDSDTSRREVTEFLRRSGQEVVATAGTLDQGLTVVPNLGKLGTTLAILNGDLTEYGFFNQPAGQDGQMIAAAIRKLYPTMPIIAYSAGIYPWASQNCQKPCDPDDLLNVIESIPVW